MKNSESFLGHVADLLEPVGGVTVKKMFGGAGAFRQGLMIACIASDVLYLRASGERAETLKAQGMGQFVPHFKGKPNPKMSMPYFQVPESLMDDADGLHEHALAAFEDALAADRKKPKSKRKHKV